VILNFTVPENLYGKIEAYDTVKPKIAKKANGGPVFPRAGIPENLVPENILPKQQLLNIIETLNRSNDSYYTNVGQQHHIHNQNKILICKLANKYWFAIWFDHNDSEAVFHYSLCLRNLSSYKSYRDGYFFKDHKVHEEDFISQKHNKKEYLYLFRSVTPEDLKNRKYELFPHFPTYNVHGVFLTPFRTKLAKYIRIWNNERDLFRAYNTPLAHLIGYYDSSLSLTELFDWVPDTAHFIKMTRSHNEIVSILETPFFKKAIQAHIQSFIDEYNSMERYRAITSGTLQHKIRAINFAYFLYGEELPLDLYQQIWNANLRNSAYAFDVYHHSEFVTSWMRNNVPVKSFVNMFVRSPIEISDSVSMLSDILKWNGVITYEGRWRPKEFHDHIMSEQWKLRNKNEKLNQDLFPQPLKVENMTYIQPIDTHQLSKWGQAVRNCVGNSTYINGIKNKTHFIILGLKNNEPYLTVQARLENQNFKVIQIAKVCNASLTNEETQEFNKTFSKALEIRTKEIANQP
jgi:hypothetical protein